MTIRAATVGDVDRIVEMGLAFRASLYDHVITENEAAMRAFAETMVTRPDRVVFVLEERGGALTGMFGAFVFDHPMSGERMASEAFWWVEPSARGVNGLRLWQRAEQWAIEQGAAALQMVAPNVAVGRLYAARGYMEVERSFQRRF